MKDNRDPQALGSRIIAHRASGAHPKNPERLSDIVDRIPAASVPDWTGDGLMSNNPADHHSKTPQDRPVESDGGE